MKPTVLLSFSALYQEAIFKKKIKKTTPIEMLKRTYKKSKPKLNHLIPNCNAHWNQ
jgi:hypothetical protein